MTENLPLCQQSQLHKMTGSHSLVRSSHFFCVLPIARPRAFGISGCRVRFWPFPPLSPKRTADIDVFVELWKQVPGQFHDPADFSQPLAFEIFCMSEMRIMLDRFEDWYSRQFHYKMRVARLISKRYNHHGKQNSTAAIPAFQASPSVRAFSGPLLRESWTRVISFAKYRSWDGR